MEENQKVSENKEATPGNVGMEEKTSTMKSDEVRLQVDQTDVKSPGEAVVQPITLSICPEGSCQRTFDVLQLTEHIKKEHKNCYWRENQGKSHEQKLLLKSNKYLERPSQNWYLVTWEYDNRRFFGRFRKADNLWFAWVVVLGNQSVADQYDCQITLVEDTKMINFGFKGKVSPINLTENEILKSGKCLVMSNKHIENFMSKKLISEERKQKGFDSKLRVVYEILD